VTQILSQLLPFLLGYLAYLGFEQGVTGALNTVLVVTWLLVPLGILATSTQAGEIRKLAAVRSAIGLRVSGVIRFVLAGYLVWHGAIASGVLWAVLSILLWVLASMVKDYKQAILEVDNG